MLPPQLHGVLGHAGHSGRLAHSFPHVLGASCSVSVHICAEGPWDVNKLPLLQLVTFPELHLSYHNKTET